MSASFASVSLFVRTRLSHRIQVRRTVSSRNLGRFSLRNKPTLSSLKHNFADSEPVSQTFETQVPKWPAADSLIEQIERVQSIPEMRQWSQATKELLTELSSANPNSSAHANCLQRLQAQSNSLPQINHKLWRRFEQATNRSTNSQFRIDLAQQHCDVSRLSYRLSRRLEVWNSLVGAQIRGRRQENLSDSPFNSASFHRMSFDHIVSAMDRVFAIGRTSIELQLTKPQSSETTSCRSEGLGQNLLTRAHAPSVRICQAGHWRRARWHPAKGRIRTGQSRRPRQAN